MGVGRRLYTKDGRRASDRGEATGAAPLSRRVRAGRAAAVASRDVPRSGGSETACPDQPERRAPKARCRPERPPARQRRVGGGPPPSGAKTPHAPHPPSPARRTPPPRRRARGAARGALGQAPVTGADAFTVQDVMIPMRDGVRLHTKIFAPKDQREPLPIIMKRTPYGIEGAAGSFDALLQGAGRRGLHLRVPGHPREVRVRGHVRDAAARARAGRHEGDRRRHRHLRHHRLAAEERAAATTAASACSACRYDGWTTIMGALEPHPALKAISPQASPADMWLGDDFHHNGAFRLSYGFEYAAMMETGKDVQQFAFDRYDTFDWYLTLGPLANVNAQVPARARSRPGTTSSPIPTTTSSGSGRRMVPHLTSVKVPTLNVAGWWDQEDFYGPVRIYEALEKHDTRAPELPRRRAVEPRRLVGRRRRDARRRSRSAATRRSTSATRCRRRSFAYFLKDKGTLDSARGADVRGRQQPVAAMGRVAAEAATRERGALLRRRTERSSFEHAARRRGEATARRVTSPTRRTRCRIGSGPIQATYFPGGSKWSTWLVEDQRFVDDRADVLSWETAPLDDDVTIAGEVVAHLFASTTGTRRRLDREADRRLPGAATRRTGTWPATS